MKKIFTFLLFICLIALPNILTAQEQKNHFDNNGWANKIKKQGVLKVGFDSFVPWAMQDKKGEFIGFEIDVANALAKELNVRIQYMPTNWDGIIPALLTNKFDILIGGMGITEERQKRVLFTSPYEYSGVALAASTTLAKGFSKIEDFNKKDVIVVVKLGTTAEITAKKLVPQATILPFGDEGQASQELKNAKAHAFLAGAPLPKQLALKNPQQIFIPIEGTLNKEEIGMALAPGNEEALPALNAWIKEQTEAGWFEKRWSFWFETLEWENQIK